MPKIKKYRLLLPIALAAVILSFSGCPKTAMEQPSLQARSQQETSPEASPQTPCLPSCTDRPYTGSADFPPYAGQPYTEVHDNLPYFSEGDLTDQSFETYGELDELGRCRTAFACIGTDLMPTQERGSIGSVKPSGWHTVKYPEIIEDNYLYNRCHLIGYQLSGENANERNLITGTRYLNLQGMLPLENMVADYVTSSGNHVLYRVTPVFDGDNLIASGVLIEALSVEDSGEGISFCVYAYNIQPGVDIDYATGESRPGAEAPQETLPYETPPQNSLYILNTNTLKFHRPSCKSVEQIKEKNKKEYSGTRDEVISQGYAPCKNCEP